jgi:hypothetical protein
MIIIQLVICVGGGSNYPTTFSKDMTAGSMAGLHFQDNITFHDPLLICKQKLISAVPGACVATACTPSAPILSL